MGVMYNKDVFTKVGVQPPKNYADFLAICDKIKKAGITPIYEAGKTGGPCRSSLSRASRPSCFR